MRLEFKRAVAQMMRLHAASWEFGNDSEEADALREEIDDTATLARQRADGSELTEVEDVAVGQLSALLNMYEDAETHLFLCVKLRDEK